MSTLREAAQQALEALEQRDNATLWHQATHALRDALAQEDEMREMLRTLGFGSQCPESIGITLRRWRDGYAAALAQQEQEPGQAEREKVAHWMRSMGYATGHGDTIEDLLDHLGTQIAEGLEAEVQAAVAAEREACAKVCEGIGDGNKWSDAHDCAAAIRARSKT